MPFKRIFLNYIPMFHAAGFRRRHCLFFFILSPLLIFSQEPHGKHNTFFSLYTDCSAPAVLGGPNFSRTFKGVVQFSGGVGWHSIKRKASLHLNYQYASAQAGINALSLPTNIFTLMQFQSLLLQLNKSVYSDAMWDLQVFAAGGKTMVSARRSLCASAPASFSKNTWQAGLELGLRAQERVWVGAKFALAYYAWQYDYNDYCMGSFYSFPDKSRDAGIWQLFTGFYARIQLGENGSEE